MPNTTEYNREYYQKTAGKFEPRFYTPQEDRMIMRREFSDYEISQRIHRSMKSIVMRRYKLKHNLVIGASLYQD